MEIDKYNMLKEELYSDDVIPRLNLTFYSSARKKKIIEKYKNKKCDLNRFISILIMIPVVLIYIGIIVLICWFMPNPVIGAMLGILLYYASAISWMKLNDIFPINTFSIEEPIRNHKKVTKNHVKELITNK